MNRYERVVITGGGGMLAHALLRSLACRGHRGVAVDRAICDISSEADVARMFRESRPTLLINCAAHTKVDLCEEQEDRANVVNGHAVGTLAEMAKQHQTTLVHYSTDFVFDGTGTRPYEPDDEVNPLSAYGRSKLLGERKLQAIDPPGWLILRTAWLYGPRGACFPQTMVNAARAGKPLKVVSDQTGSPTFTYDLADATFELLDRGATGLWHLTNTGQTTWFDFTAAILEEFALKTDLSPTTAAEWKKLRPNSAIRPAYSVLDGAPFARLVGRPMRPWREALHDYRLHMDKSAAAA
jgi:dTDP-4-dehydrorhamnose reductase